MCDIGDEKLVKPRVSLYTKYIKRLLDIIICSFALVVLSPVLLIICILELAYHGKPILYAVNRPGKNGKLFKLYKFRSMSNQKDANGELLPDAERLTKFGQFLRKWSLDELPELLNIVKGDMSIIGPRPLLVKYLNLYTPRHMQRHAVRPGLCCLRLDAKKRGLSEDTWTWRDQFESDLYYVEHISFLTDLKMVFAVVKEVFRHSDNRVNATRVEFDGTNLDETRSVDEIEQTRSGTVV